MTTSADFETFRRRSYQLTGIDLESYSPDQVQRRLQDLLRRHGCATFAAYAALLDGDQQRCQEFRDFLTINVTDFFRDSDRYELLQRAVLPGLLDSASGLRVWSAGCSTGAEPYSLAIALREIAPRASHRILATDIDRTVLARARSGADYREAELHGLSRTQRERYFTRGAPDRYQVSPDIRALVTFQQHDLLRDPYPTGPFDLIACRNVVIYFTDKARATLYQGFVRVVRPGGVLFVGGTEAIMGAASLGLESIAPGFYRRAAGAPSRCAA